MTNEEAATYLTQVFIGARGPGRQMLSPQLPTVSGDTVTIVLADGTVLDLKVTARP